jgi:hypothetical protein
VGSRSPGWRRQPQFLEQRPRFTRLQPGEPGSHGWQRLLLLFRYRLATTGRPVPTRCQSRSHPAALTPGFLCLRVTGLSPEVSTGVDNRASPDRLNDNAGYGDTADQDALSCGPILKFW